MLGIWLKFASEIPYGLRHNSLVGSRERMLFGQEMLRISTGIADIRVVLFVDVTGRGKLHGTKNEI